MKKAKRAISFLLCLVLITGVFCASAFALDADKYKNIPYKGYTYIGDSIAWGFGLDRDKDPASADFVCSRETGAYGDLIGKLIEDRNGGVTYPAATSGARLCDYRMAIEAGMGKENPYVYNDWYSANRAPARSDKLRGMGDELCAWLRESDLISIQLGYNDVLAAPMFTLQDSGMMNDLMAALDSDMSADDFESFLKSEMKLYGLLGDYFKNLASVLLGGLDSFRVNTLALVKDINEVSGKNADIVLVGYYNPYNNLREFENSDLTPLLDAMTIAVSAMNDYYSEIADMYDNVYYVDAMDVSLFFPDGMLYSDAKADPDYMLYGAHPDPKGYE